MLKGFVTATTIIINWFKSSKLLNLLGHVIWWWHRVWFLFSPIFFYFPLIRLSDIKFTEDELGDLEFLSDFPQVKLRCEPCDTNKPVPSVRKMCLQMYGKNGCLKSPAMKRSQVVCSYRWEADSYMYVRLLSFSWLNAKGNVELLQFCFAAFRNWC